MQYIVGLMMVIFPLVGCFLIYSGLNEFLKRRERLEYMVRVEGAVMTVTRKRQPGLIARKSRHQRQGWMFFPVIRFTAPSGEQITFESESGDGGQTSQYSAGQRLPVLYDPEGKLPPMIDSWWSVWGGAFFLVLGGAVFIGGGLLIFVAFGNKILS
jgi:hypothetical protein